MKVHQFSLCTISYALLFKRKDIDKKLSYYALQVFARFSYMVWQIQTDKDLFLVLIYIRQEETFAVAEN